MLFLSDRDVKCSDFKWGEAEEAVAEEEAKDRSLLFKVAFSNVYLAACMINTDHRLTRFI